MVMKIEEDLKDLRELPPEETGFARMAEECLRKRETDRWESMKSNGQVEEAVLIAHPKWKEDLWRWHNVIYSPNVEEDKIYQVTDKEIAENIRRACEWRKCIS